MKSPTHEHLSKADILSRFHNIRVKQLQEEQINELDRADLRDPQACAEVALDCCRHMLATEKDYLPSPQYMGGQTDINEKMRGILIDWLIEVHLKFKLLPETLYLTIHIIDRYLEKQEVLRTKLQLVGVTAMLIASKYEEIYAPEIKDFVWITDKAFSKEEILRMEFSILTELQFNVTTPSPYRFLERFSKVSGSDAPLFDLARYLLELCLLECRMLKYTPSMQAATAVYLAHMILQRPQHWTETLTQHSGYNQGSLRDCAKDMCMLLKGIEKCSLQAVRKKFSLPKFNEVAKIRIEQ